MTAQKTLTAIINPRNKPMYLGVSTEVPHEGRVFIFDKIKSTAILIIGGDGKQPKLTE